MDIEVVKRRGVRQAAILLAVATFASSTAFSWSVAGVVLTERLISTLNWFFWPIASVISIIIAQHENLFKTIKRNWLFVWLLVFCTISSVWSLDPKVTIQRSVLAVMVSITAASISTRLEVVTLTKVIVFVLLCIAVVGVTDEIVMGNLAQLYPIRAGYNSRNAFGLSLGLAIVLAYPLISILNRTLIRVMLSLLIILLLVILVLADSRTSMVAVVISVAAIAFTKFLTRGRSKSTALVVLSIFMFLVFTSLIGVIAQTPILYWLGRSRDFTGRITGWSYAVQLIAARPIIGSGFNGYWSSEAGITLRSNLGWSYASFHNNYVEYLVGLGVVGTLMLVTLICILYFRAITLIKIDAKLGFTLLSFMVAFTVASLTESLLQRPNDIWFFTFCLMLFMSTGNRPNQNLSSVP